MSFNIIGGGRSVIKDFVKVGSTISWFYGSLLKILMITMKQKFILIGFVEGNGKEKNKFEGLDLLVEIYINVCLQTVVVFCIISQTIQAFFYFTIIVIYQIRVGLELENPKHNLFCQCRHPGAGYMLIMVNFNFFSQTTTMMSQILFSLYKPDQKVLSSFLFPFHLVLLNFICRQCLRK